MNQLKKVMDKVLSVICEVMFCFMTVIAVYQVITRYVFSRPSSFSEELLTYSFAWVAMFATTLVFGESEHMRLSFFSDKLSGRNAVLLSIISEVLILVFAALVLIFGGVSIVKLTLTQVTASLGIPMGYVYTIMPVSGVLIAIYNIINISNLCARLKDADRVPNGQEPAE